MGPVGGGQLVCETERPLPRFPRESHLNILVIRELCSATPVRLSGEFLGHGSADLARGSAFVKSLLAKGEKGREE